MKDVVGVRRWRLTVVVVIGWMTAALSMSGCLFWGAGAELQRAQAAADLLEARVNRLEQIRAAEVAGAAVSPAISSEGLIASSTLAGSAAIPGTEVSTVATLGTIPLEGAGTGGFQFPQLGLPSRAAMRKLLRGFVNVLTGWVELPKRIHETSEASGAGAGFTFGLARGLGYAFIRTIGGVYEVVTFPFPAPRNYRPVMRPEFIFVCEDDV